MKEKIILREDVDHLGLAGEVVEVQKGYARNYLYPKALAVAATPVNRKMLAEKMATVAERRMRQVERLKAVATQLEEVVLTIPAKVGESGRLFGSVTTMDLAKALTDQGHEIDRKKIELKSPIKTLGEHDFHVRLQAGVTARLWVNVVNEAAPSAPAEAAPEPEAETAPAEGQKTEVAEED